VINEGNFSDHNGSLTSYNPQTKSAEQQAFEKANDRPLAGYIQSSTIIGDSLYIVSNSSDKIEVVDLHTLTSIGTIKYSGTPAYITPAGDGTAYVTNLYDGSVSILNLKTRKQTAKTISVGSAPYFAYKADGKVFVSNNGYGDNNTISVIDVASGAVEKTLTVGAGPQQIVEDPSGRLWVVCQGKEAYDADGNRDPKNDLPGGIYIIDPKRELVTDSIQTGGRPKQITLDAKDSRAYLIFAAGDVEAININTLQVINPAFIDRSFNAIGYSPKERILYLGESKGLTQPGQVIRYNLQGMPVDSFATGISPIGFQFVEK
jgi:YVTN family beta-propeller protein